MGFPPFHKEFIAGVVFTIEALGGQFGQVPECHPDREEGDQERNSESQDGYERTAAETHGRGQLLIHELCGLQGKLRDHCYNQRAENKPQDRQRKRRKSTLPHLAFLLVSRRGDSQGCS
jgi:hypothetical protein